MTSQQYEQTRSCAKCDYEETRFLDELTAAFEETRTWEKPCEKCGSTDFGGSNALPPLSRAQLEIWAINDELHFSQQDEDLILATPSNLELLLEFLDSPNTHIWQRRTLASALYVLWYDSYPQTGESYLHDAEFAEKVALEINKRTELFIELEAIADYLKEKFEKYNAKV
ncbi:MAG: hypothetical protein HC815_27665 [Richelia sp. RM1_1_1]|nr:hypothetical protein [Richelia sp. RM1_1_1]